MLLFFTETKNEQEQQQTFVPPVTYIFVLFFENSGSRATDWEKTSNIKNIRNSKTKAILAKVLN